MFSKLNVTKLLIYNYLMHNLYAIFVKFLEICKEMAGNLVTEQGNILRAGVVPGFSDLEIIALNMTSEVLGIDSESYFFSLLQDYRKEVPYLISRRLYNDRRKFTASLCNTIRKRRARGCSTGKKDLDKAPSFGYYASQGVYHYGYKLHALCGLKGVIHSFDLANTAIY